VSPSPILVYCQHLLGLGHLQRAARLARALAEAGEPVAFVTGGRPVPALELGAAEVITLPPLQSADAAASTVAGPDGRPPDPAYLAARREQLLALVAARDPAVVLLELFPFGRHALAFELAPLLFALGDDRVRRGPAAPRVAVSVRDVLVSKANAAWSDLAVLAVVLQWVDRVLVHGAPDVIPLEQTFAPAARLGDRLVYTGYLAPPPPATPPVPHGEVVVSGGGGQVAADLFRAALAARPFAGAAVSRPWRLLLGPYCPEVVRAELERAAPGFGTVAGRPAVTVEPFHADLASHLRGAALSVSQAGYNTILDILASGVRAVVVPYEASGDEQLLRAGLLAERGLVRVLPEARRTPATLAATMDAALTDPGFPAPARLALDGAQRAVEVLVELATSVRAARRRESRPMDRSGPPATPQPPSPPTGGRGARRRSANQRTNPQSGWRA
jgi:predicted glycosyltransferase